MLKKVLFVLFLCTADLLLLLVFWPRHETGQHTAALNAAVHIIEQGSADYSRLAEELAGTGMVLLDANGGVLYTSSEHVPIDPVAGAGAGYATLPVKLADGPGTLIIENPEMDAARNTQDEFAVLSIVFVIVFGISLLAYLLWLDRRIVRPFRNIQNVAEEIARGNLDMPLSMDRGGTFGAFTESFDLMRAELSRAQASEAKALSEKKELVAKLSHDLRTPIASIQAVSELGALTSDGAAAERFSQIHDKTQQMNLLVGNLLNAAIEEQTELAVALRCVQSSEIEELLRGSDYQQWVVLTQQLPDCAVMADPVRLQQVFDNILINAYKYGKAPVTVSGYLQNGEFLLEAEDAGGGVPMDEVPKLHMKYFRGSNAKNAPGGGLGLYICNELLAAMNAEMLVRNGDTGLAISVILPLCRRKAAFSES